jgi:hypothetical protein
MIGNVMLFLLAVSGVAAAAAFLAEDGLRRVGVPTRAIWLVAMSAPALLLVVPRMMPAASVGTPLGAIPVITLAPLTIELGSSPASSRPA